MTCLFAAVVENLLLFGKCSHFRLGGKKTKIKISWNFIRQEEKTTREDLQLSSMEVRLKPLFAGGASISIPEGVTKLGRNNMGVKDKTCSREQVHIIRADTVIDLVGVKCCQHCRQLSSWAVLNSFLLLNLNQVGTNPSSLISDAGRELRDPWKILKGQTIG